MKKLLWMAVAVAFFLNSSKGVLGSSVGPQMIEVLGETRIGKCMGLLNRGSLPGGGYFSASYQDEVIFFNEDLSVRSRVPNGNFAIRLLGNGQILAMHQNELALIGTDGKKLKAVPYPEDYTLWSAELVADFEDGSFFALLVSETDWKRSQLRYYGPDLELKNVTSLSGCFLNHFVPLSNGGLLRSCPYTGFHFIGPEGKHLVDAADEIVDHWQQVDFFQMGADKTVLFTEEPDTSGISPDGIRSFLQLRGLAGEILSKIQLEGEVNESIQIPGGFIASLTHRARIGSSPFWSARDRIDFFNEEGALQARYDHGPGLRAALRRSVYLPGSDTLALWRGKEEIYFIHRSGELLGRYKLSDRNVRLLPSDDGKELLIVRGEHRAERVSPDGSVVHYMFPTRLKYLQREESGEFSATSLYEDGGNCIDSGLMKFRF